MRDFGSLSFGLAGDRRLGQAGRAVFHHEGMLERIPRRFDVRRARARLIVTNIVADQMTRDAELHVSLDVLVVGYVELRDQCLEARLVNQKVQMSGAHIVAPLRAQQFADRTVDRNRIAGRLDAAEADMTVGIGPELATQVHVGLYRVLIFVKAFRRGLPDVDLGARDRFAVHIAKPGVDKQRRTRSWRTHDRATIWRARRIHAPKRAEKIGVGFGLATIAVVKETDQTRKAKRAGHQHSFIMGLVGMLPQGDDVADRRLKFLLGQLHLAGKTVQVADERGQDLAQARIFGARNFAQYRFRDVFLVFNDHRAAPRATGPCGPVLWARTLRDRLRARHAAIPITTGAGHISPSSRSSRRKVSGMAAAPLAALSRSRGASLRAR